jgi:hypothetical protein
MNQPLVARDDDQFPPRGNIALGISLCDVNVGGLLVWRSTPNLWGPGATHGRRNG